MHHQVGIVHRRFDQVGAHRDIGRENSAASASPSALRARGRNASALRVLRYRMLTTPGASRRASYGRLSPSASRNGTAPGKAGSTGAEIAGRQQHQLVRLQPRPDQARDVGMAIGLGGDHHQFAAPPRMRRRRRAWPAPAAPAARAAVRIADHRPAGAGAHTLRNFRRAARATFSAARPGGRRAPAPRPMRSRRSPPLPSARSWHALRRSVLSNITAEGAAPLAHTQRGETELRGGTRKKPPGLRRAVFEGGSEPAALLST